MCTSVYLFAGSWEAVVTPNAFLQFALSEGSLPVEVAMRDKGKGTIKFKYVTSALGE